MSGLREIRQSIEALPPDPPAEQTFAVNIVSVESGHFMSELAPNGYRVIEHQAELPTLEPPEAKPTSEPEPEPRLTALEAKLLAMDHDQLLQLAEKLHVGK